MLERAGAGRRRCSIRRNRVLLITGPNTGGKTVALKTAGLFALMAQSGLHVPADGRRGCRCSDRCSPTSATSSRSTASLSTFSSHITNLVSMDRDAASCRRWCCSTKSAPAPIPNEGGALATAIVQHFRQRGALVMATTHFDAVKTWGIGTEGVAVAAFAFDPQNFAPTYRLIYGAPGRSLAIEMAQRLGMPQAVVAAARGFLSDDQKRLQAHLVAPRRAGARARGRAHASSIASGARSTRPTRRSTKRETRARRARRGVQEATERAARRSRCGRRSATSMR